ncbi:MAG TPA: SMC family ATPase [Thermodesulfobacteriota bacterium]|nr:SMC family ATPase [Thermodesulfobacteriota bacterium]
MIPLKLSLKNFLSYSEDVPILDFTGFTVACLSGKNGHGKSALLDAITWALWGKCRVKTKEEVIKRGATRAAVELEFEVEGNCYRVIRTITRRKRGSVPSVDFQAFDAETYGYRSLDHGAKTQDIIEKILKIDYDSFICSSFILQGRADEFTKRTPAERKDVLAGILELEKYEKLSKRARELAQESKLKVESLETQIAQLDSEITQKPSLGNELRQVRSLEEKVVGELEEIEKLYRGIIRESEALSIKIESYNKLIKSRIEAREKSVKLEEELNGLTKEIEKDKEVTSKEREIVEGYSKLERIREKERIFSEKLIGHTNLLKEREGLNRLINDEKSKIEQKISSLSGKREELEKRLGQVREVIKRKEEIEAGFERFLRLQSVEKELEEKKKLREKLKYRERDLITGIREIKFQLEAKRDELKAKIKELIGKAGNEEKLAKECEKLSADIKACEEIKANSESLKAKLREIGGEKRALISRKSEILKRQKEEIDKLNLIKSQAAEPHCPLCESHLEKEARQALVEKLENSLLHLKGALEEESKRIEQLEGQEKKTAAEIRTAEATVSNLPLLNKKLGEKEKSLEEAISAKKNLELAEEELSKAKDMLEKEEFGFELRDELKKITNDLAKLGYDEGNHTEVKNRIEFLRKFQTENELLENAKRDEHEVENHLTKIENEVLLLTRTINEADFAAGYRERVVETERRIKETGYNEKIHRVLKANLASLENFSKEKENLDRIKLSLSHREEKRTGLEGQLNFEREKINNIEEEIKELEEAVGRGESLREKKKLIEGKISELKRAKDDTLAEKKQNYG